MNRTKVALAVIVMVGVIAIVVGTVVSATTGPRFSEPTPEPTCAYTSGCEYSTVDR
jgi:hypothetical protein